MARAQVLLSERVITGELKPTIVCNALFCLNCITSCDKSHDMHPRDLSYCTPRTASQPEISKRVKLMVNGIPWNDMTTPLQSPEVGIVPPSAIDTLKFDRTVSCTLRPHSLQSEDEGNYGLILSLKEPR